MSTLTHSNTLTVLTCGNCGIGFAIPESLNETALRDHKINFYCPMGHYIGYSGKTEAQRLRESLEYERRSAEYARNRAQQAIRSRNAMKGQVTKIKNRVAKGVCPCCNRSFPALASHMESEHPDYVEAQ